MIRVIPVLVLLLLTDCSRRAPTDDGPGAGIPADSVLPPLQVGAGEFAFRTRSLQPEYLVSAVRSISAIRCEFQRINRAYGVTLT